MQLRMLALWRQVTGSDEESLIIMGVIAITGDRLTNYKDASPELRDMANPVPRSLLGKCNIRSIAGATGMNRETARRRIKGLIDRGVLERGPGRSIHFTAGRIQGENAYRISQMQLDEFTRTANALMRDGLLAFDPQA